MQIGRFVSSLVCIVVLSQPLRSDEGRGGSEDDDAVESPVRARVIAIIDVVLDHHIDPPTRQEMILPGVRAIYQLNEQSNPQSRKRTQPRGLSRRVSELVTSDEIENFLKKLMTEFDAVRGADGVFVRGMLECVRGGASLTNAEASRVNAQVAANRYVGTGIVLGGNDTKEKTFAIRKVIYNGSAWKAGAKDGELIVAVDEKATDKMQLNQLLEASRAALQRP
jgi:hypothetical protein